MKNLKTNTNNNPSKAINSDMALLSATHNCLNYELIDDTHITQNGRERVDIMKQELNKMNY